MSIVGETLPSPWTFIALGSAVIVALLGGQARADGGFEGCESFGVLLVCPPPNVAVVRHRLDGADRLVAAHDPRTTSQLRPLPKDEVGIFETHSDPERLLRRMATAELDRMGSVLHRERMLEVDAPGFNGGLPVLVLVARHLDGGDVTAMTIVPNGPSLSLALTRRAVPWVEQPIDVEPVVDAHGIFVAALSPTEPANP